MMFAIKRGRRPVAHLADHEFGRPLCGRPADFTINVPLGRPRCKDCARIYGSTELRRVRVA